MKMGVALVVALIVFGASSGHAQSRAGGSDDFLCTHGDQAESRTIAACKRLRSTGDEVESDTPPAYAAAEPAQPPTGENPMQSDAYASPSAEFHSGQAARLRYEAWVHSLTGDHLAGASYWEAHRSVPDSAPCTAASNPTASSEWIAGCMAARQVLAGPDRLRHMSPEFRSGWNHPPPSGMAPIVPPPTNTTIIDAGEVPPAASAPIAETPPPQSLPTAAPPAEYKPQSNLGSIVSGVAVLGIALVVAGLAIYFLPTLIAAGRKKRNAAAIFALNLFLGWTLIGWVLALVWSLSADPQVVA